MSSLVFVHLLVRLLILFPGLLEGLLVATAGIGVRGRGESLLILLSSLLDLLAIAGRHRVAIGVSGREDTRGGVVVGVLGGVRVAIRGGSGSRSGSSRGLVLII